MAKHPGFAAKQDSVRIRGYSENIARLANENDVKQVVSSLSVGHLDPRGREITNIGNYGPPKHSLTVRLDRQSNTSEGSANLQIQVNNSALKGSPASRDAGTTISQVIVPAAVYQVAVTCHEHSVQTHLANIVRSALIASYKSKGYQYTITEN